jgi:GH35 family endo-1,4-beta-xylanase
VLLTTVTIIALLFSGASTADSAEESDGELLATADERIERHRKADAIIAVVDAAGEPVSGAKLTVEQTRHAFLFGCNIFKWDGFSDEQLQAAYRNHFAELLNFATLPFYWTMYEPRRGEPIHERTERVARWCKQHGIITKGHPLAWNMGDPRWLPDDLEEIRRLQMARIEDCVSRFAGLIDRWDVVNEATHFDRAEFANRRAPKHSAMWKKVGQMEFTRECFVHARRAGPKATLLINDYRTDPPYERVIEQLVDEQGKRMYDVIGIQSHMHGGTWPNRKIWTVCERFARFGVPLHFTETTILSGQRSWQRSGPWPSTPEGETYQAREAARFYTMLFSHPAVEAITWWDFSDRGAWKQAPAGFLRKDMTPKPMYDELKKLIKGKWWTKTTVETGADGKAALRGFLGDYKVTVAVEGKEDVVKQFTLEKGEKNRWVLELE